MPFRWWSVCVQGIISLPVSLCPFDLSSAQVTETRHGVVGEKRPACTVGEFLPSLMEEQSSFIPASSICIKVARIISSLKHFLELFLPTSWNNGPFPLLKGLKSKFLSFFFLFLFMGTKVKHMCSIWRMQMPQAVAFLSPALSKWPFRLNCSSQHSPIKNGHQQGKGYLLIHKRYERQYLFCLRFLFTCLGENLNSWNSQQVICVCI